MNTWTKPFAVLLLIVGSAFFMEPRASAQLGSLVVTITAPAAGSTVTGTTTVSAQVSIVGTLTVSSVQFKLDGADLGAADTSAPYSIAWNTKTASNGSHTLTAVARDALGVNWTSEPVNVTVFNDLTPPTVTISSPASGANLRGTVSMTAGASDNVGVVGVQFKLDGANFGPEMTTAPYTLPWNTTTTTNGSHVVTATARDAAGNTATSPSVTVVIDNTPPAVSITAPAAGSTVAGAIAITANASDNLAVAGVQFFVDGAPLGSEDVMAPYEASWDTATASNGSHVLTAVARDAAGNTTTSASVTVTIDNSPPAVSITSPSAGSTVSASITVTAGASDNVAVAGVQFFLDGAPLGVEDTSAPYAASWDTTTATNGSHSLTATARDAAGNSATSAAVSVTVFNDTTPPAVSLTSPAAAATVSGSITVTASASDNVAVAGVQFFIDGAMLGVEDTTEPYAVSWDTTTAGNGSRVLTAVARDGAGHSTTSAAVTVTVLNDTTPPSVTITSPANASTVGGTVTVTADASDDVAVAGVQFFLDGAPLGAEDTSAPYVASWDTTTATNGSHSLTATARDAAGKIATSAAVSVTVLNDTTPPAVSITSPAAAATVSGSITVTASASDNVAVAGVQFFIDGAMLGVEDTTEPYAVSWDTTTAGNGSRVLTAVARDGAGHTTTSAAVTVTVLNDTTPPSVAITSPANASTVNGTVNITADASDNVAVAGVRFFVDGVALGAEDTAAPFSAAWDTTTATEGSHTLTAIARDSAGNTSTSATVTVTVTQQTGGTVTRVEDNSTAISFTPAGEWLEGYTDARGWSGGTTALGFTALQRATLNFSGTAVSWIGFRGPQTGIANVHLDGALVATVDAYSPTEAVGAVMFTASGLVDGPHTIVIEVMRTKHEAASDYFVAVDAFDVTSNGGGVPGDTTPPTVSITSPAGGASLSGTTTITAAASDNIGVVGVKFFVDGAQLGTEDTAAPYETAWNTAAAANGAHAITAVARDAAGNTTTSDAVNVTVSNTVDTAPPTVGITSPASNATVSGTVTIAATATDDVGVAGVRFFADGSPIGVEDTSAPYEVAWNTSVTSNGAHTLTAVARDAAGNATTSASVAVTVSNTSSGEVTRIEETDTGITYTGTWAQGNMSRPWSGGTAAIAALTGTEAWATFNFTGTGVSWIGFRGPFAGIATVFLDGQQVDTIDAYSATEQLQAVMFTANGLADGAHRLIVNSTGTKNPASADSYVVVDAFDLIGPPAPPDTTPPSVAISWPGAGAAVWNTTPVSAVADDNGGVAGVRFLVDGVQIGVEDTTAPFSIVWDSRTVADGARTLTAVARDAAGNTATSAAVTITVSNAAPPPAPATTRIEDTDPAIVYTPGTPAPGQPAAWFHGSRSRDWSNATSAFNRSDTARASITFTGTSISWIGFRGFWTGIAHVYLDGVFVAEIDLFLPQCTPEQRAQGCIDEDDQAPVFTATGLAAGPHTLTVHVTGARNPGATDNAVVVDGFDIAPAFAPDITGTRVEETSAATSFTGTWAQGDTTSAWSGGTAAVSSTTGSRATVTVTGTEIRVIGRRGPQAGIARIFLDGAFQAEVDQYFPTSVQGVVYIATGLAAGSHTMTVEVTGLKNDASGGTQVAVDAFDVRSRFEERDASVSYTGTWVQEHMDKSYSGGSPNVGGGTAARSATAGARAEFTFTGPDVQWISWRGPTAGIADVSVDGDVIERIDLYAATDSVRVPVFTATGLAPGPHTLRIDVTGLRNTAASNGWVTVDAFDVVIPTPAPAVSRVQQTDAAVTYTTPEGGAGWSTSTVNKYFSGRTVTVSSTPGARAAFTFTGTDIRLIGQRRRDSGIARIYLDGNLIGEIDTFAAFQDELQAAVFAASGLAPGVTHTLTIEVTGTKRGGDTCTPSPGPSPPACSAGYMIVIDAFEIY